MMQRHTANRWIVLGLLVLFGAAPALAIGEVVGGAAIRQHDGGVRLELSIESGDLVGRALLALDLSPVEMLAPAWSRAGGCTRAGGLLAQLRRAVVLVRALGRATAAVLGRQAGAREPGATGDGHTDADRRRSS